jgi:hypothetical protein
LPVSSVKSFGMESKGNRMPARYVSTVREPARLFWAEEGLEFGVGFDDVVGHGAQDIDFEIMVFGVLEGGGDQLEGDALAALRLGDFGVPEGQPAVAIGFEFEIAGFAFLFDFEAAAGDLGWVVHSGCSLAVDDRGGLAVQAEGAVRQMRGCLCTRFENSCTQNEYGCRAWKPFFRVWNSERAVRKHRANAELELYSSPTRAELE